MQVKKIMLGGEKEEDGGWFGAFEKSSVHLSLDDYLDINFEYYSYSAIRAMIAKQCE